MMPEKIRKQEVIRELGSPGKVAAIIKEDLKNSSQNYGEFTESGYQDERVDDERQMPQSRAEKGYHAERRGGKAGVILVLIFLVFISPLIKGVAGGIIGFIVALILLPLILVLGAGAVVIALFAIAVIAIGAGIGACVTAAPAFGCSWNRHWPDFAFSWPGWTCIFCMGVEPCTSGNSSQVHGFLRQYIKQGQKGR